MDLWTSHSSWILSSIRFISRLHTGKVAWHFKMVLLPAQIFYFGKVWEKAQSMGNFWDKVSAFLKGPGWFPGTPRLGDLEMVEEVTTFVIAYVCDVTSVPILFSRRSIRSGRSTTRRRRSGSTCTWSSSS